LFQKQNNMKTTKEQENQKLIDEYKGEYKRVHGRDFPEKKGGEIELRRGWVYNWNSSNAGVPLNRFKQAIENFKKRLSKEEEIIVGKKERLAQIPGEIAHLEKEIELLKQIQKELEEELKDA
jgi:hypothetical protein